jgi:hypothetical protein
MLNPDGTTHPATYQPDLAADLTPATVIMWLRHRAAEAEKRGDKRWVELATAANLTERATIGWDPTPVTQG